MLQKKYEDFAQELYKKFPDIEEKTIDDIANYGLKKIYSYVKTGGDLFLKDMEFCTFIGQSQRDSPEQYIKSKFKEHSKRRKLFKESKTPWDGWHYIGLTEEENKNFIENGLLPAVTLYKLMLECVIRKGIAHIYRTNLGYDKPDKEVFWWEKRENYKLEDCEYSEEGRKWLDKKIAKANLKKQLEYEKNNNEHILEGDEHGLKSINNS